MSTTRTFVAVALPESMTPKLTRLQSLLAPEVPGVRWSSVSPFHTTLAFLGDVEDTDLNRVCRAVATASVGFPTFELRVEGLGVFPNPAKARTFWVGLTGPELPVLVDLQAAVAGSLEAEGYPREDRKFQPHLTLGRVQGRRGPPPDLSRLLAHYRTWSAGSFTVAEVVTFASTLTRDGPVYAPLATAALGGRKPGRPT